MGKMTAMHETIPKIPIMADDVRASRALAFCLMALAVWCFGTTSLLVAMAQACECWGMAAVDSMLSWW